MFIEMNLIPFLLMINIFSCLKNRSICPGTGFRNSIRIIKMGMIMWPGTESSIQAAFFFFRVEGAAKALADIFIIFFRGIRCPLKSDRFCRFLFLQGLMKNQIQRKVCPFGQYVKESDSEVSSLDAWNNDKEK